MPSVSSSRNQSSVRRSGSASRPRVAVIDQMAVEWRSIGRTASAVAALEDVAGRDAGLGVLVFGEADAPARCPTPCDLVTHMRRASGRVERDEAARLVRVLLREAGADPFVSRLLVQALVPGLVGVAAKLRWGQGGDWKDGEEFFGELLSTTWAVIQEWAGQDRPYAVRDLLSAIRCRVRRQLFRAKDQAWRYVPMGADDVWDRSAASETLLDELARRLVDEVGEVGDGVEIVDGGGEGGGAADEQGELGDDEGGITLEELQLLYMHTVLGYSIAELAALTGRDRRGLYARRARARRRICA